MNRDRASSIFSSFFGSTPTTTSTNSSSSSSHTQTSSTRRPELSKKLYKQCYQCEEPLSLLTRPRINCRSCGRVFCEKCTTHTTDIPYFDYPAPVPVCDHCYVDVLHKCKRWDEIERKCTKENLITYYKQSGLLSLSRDELLDMMPDSKLHRKHMEKKRNKRTKERTKKRSNSNTSNSDNSSETGNGSSTSTNGNFSNHKQKEKEEEEEEKEMSLDQYIDTIPIKRLKEILREQGLSSEDCFEREDLVQRVKEIANSSKWRGKKLYVPLKEQVQDNEEVRSRFEIENQDNCKICYDRKANAVILDCAHLCCCTFCARQMKDCPICRKSILRIVEVYRA